MMKIYRSEGNRIITTDTFDEGVWVYLVNPTKQELDLVTQSLNVEPDFLPAALDEEERARIENDNGQTLIIVDIPVVDSESMYSTIPLGIVLLRHAIITVCLKEDTLLTDFVTGKVKTFQTQFKTRFILQILYKNAMRYLSYLKTIDKMSHKIESHLHKSMKNEELIQMLALEKSLVYFSTALKSNETVLERLSRHEYVKRYPEDAELLEDVITENKQAIEMANIYSSILSGTMDAFASIISNNLNIVMKFMTSVTIVMAIPTLISSFFGMNVEMPFHAQGAFWYIVAFTAAICAAAVVLLYKKKMF